MQQDGGGSGGGERGGDMKRREGERKKATFVNVSAGANPANPDLLLYLQL